MKGRKMPISSANEPNIANRCFKTPSQVLLSNVGRNQTIFYADFSFFLGDCDALSGADWSHNRSHNCAINTVAPSIHADRGLIYRY